MAIGHKGFTKNDPNISRTGRATSTDRLKHALDEERPRTYAELGIRELSLMFRKVRSQNKQAIAVMATLMNKANASDTVKLTAAKTLCDLYLGLCKEIYMQQGDKLVSPESEVNNVEPAAVLHLRVVDSKKDNQAASND